MLNINMEFLRGILFVRLKGILNKKSYKTFEEEVFPVVLKHEIKYIVINLDSVNVIDIYGIESLIKLNDIAISNNGKTTLCSLTSKQVKELLHKDIYQNKFYETADELTAIGVINL